MATQHTTPKARVAPHTGAPAIHYQVATGDPSAHLFHITLTIARPAAQQRLCLPVWIPGSYLVREFSKHLQGLQARQGRRTAQPLALTQTDKSSWLVACDPALPLVLSYQVYALDNSVRTAWLDAARGFFNGTSLCLQVQGQEDQAHHLTLSSSAATRSWSVATGLAPLSTDARGFGSYRAANYDELVDCPVEMGAFWQGQFTAGGIPHRFVVAGAAPSFDGDRLLADTQLICQAHIRFWHGQGKAPHKNYVFMLNAVHEGYGGLEHRNSTALICNRRDLPRSTETKPAEGKTSDAKAKLSEGYTTLLGLISHEYFHTWNVKRLRPIEFARYAYDRENLTHLLWFFEGFTSYYDDLLLRRTGLLDDAAYLKLLNKTINQVLQTPGRHVQSVAQASFDAWTKYYRPDENTPNATVSYYTKGALVALCLDLTLRQEGHGTLDAVMRGLWLRCKAGPMSEADLLAVLAQVGGRSYAPEIEAWVHGTAELPLKTLLSLQGLSVLEEPAQTAQRLGLRVAEGDGLRIKLVLRGGAAEQAGLAPGDEWLGVDVGAKAAGGSWRLGSLDDLALYAGRERQLTALVARDKRLLRLPLELPQGATTWRLALREGPTRAWPAS